MPRTAPAPRWRHSPTPGRGRDPLHQGIDKWVRPTGVRLGVTMAAVGSHHRARAVVSTLVALTFLSCGAAQTNLPRDSHPAPVGAGATARVEGVQGGSMTVAATVDAVSFHPYKTTDTASSGYQHLVFAGGLLQRNPHNIDVFDGGLAESWTLSEDRLA